MGIKISGQVSVTHSFTGHNGDFKYDIEDLGYSEEEFLELTDEEKEKFLDEILETEIQNVLDCDIGWEQY